jgi:hypothetical protein
VTDSQGPRLLGLWGYAGSGKDTAAEALVADGWTRAAFAGPVYAALLALDPYVDAAAAPLSLVVARLGWEKSKRHYAEVRGLLQRMGTEAGRKVHGENVWIDALFRTVEPGQGVVITDVRFPNEAAEIRHRGGKVVGIMRAGVEPANEHSSENAMRGYPLDYFVANDGTVAELHAKMRRIAGLS